MATTVYLHTGTPKSGTSSVQAFLTRNKAALARAGLMFPGERWSEQVAAARDILRIHGGASPRRTPTWQSLVEQLAAFDGDGVISMEWLGNATTRGRRHMLASLAPARVEVIITVRDLGRTIPAHWQESVQNAGTSSWEELLEGACSDSPYATAAGDRFWRQHGVDRQVAEWQELLPSDRIHVVTVPRADADPRLLLRRFGSVIGVDPDDYEVDGGGRTKSSGVENRSLGLESAMVMYRINLSLAGSLTESQYNEHAKAVLAKRLLRSSARPESRLVVPPHLRDWVAARADAMTGDLQASGADIVGDLTDLAPYHHPEGIQPQDVDQELVLEAALDGLAGMVRARARLARRLRRRIAELGGAPLARNSHPRRRDRMARAGETVRARIAANPTARRIYAAVRRR